MLTNPFAPVCYNGSPLVGNGAESQLLQTECRLNICGWQRPIEERRPVAFLPVVLPSHQVPMGFRTDNELSDG